MSIITVFWDVNYVGHYNFLSANSIFWRSDFAAECEDAVEHSQPVIIITHFYYLACYGNFCESRLDEISI